VERGEVGRVPLGALVQMADALGMSADLVLRWQGSDLDRLLNARHSALHESLARWFAHQPGWAIAPEVSFSIYGERGVIDILAWHAASRSLLAIELKTDIVDVNDLMGSVDRKRRLAARVARERGWDAASVSCWVIVAQGRTNRRRVASHRATLRAAFPDDGIRATSWVKAPAGTIAALSMWTDDHQVDVTGGLATVRRVRVGAMSLHRTSQA
jgi:hypothetical protein